MLAAGLALSSLALGACDLAMSGFHEEARDTWSKTWPLDANGRLEIVNTNGSIQVDPADITQVEVHAERLARAATQQGAKEILEKLEMEEEASSDRVHLAVKSPSMVGFHHGNYEIRYTVRVPRGASVDLHETNGQLNVTGLTHETRLATTNGQIIGRGLDGAVRATTTNGRVQLQLVGLTRDVEVQTTNGTIDLQVPPTASAAISARVTNGRVGVENLPALKTEDDNSRRNFNGRLNGGDHAIRLSTTNGSITISGGPAAAGSAGKGDKEPVER